ncbi:MBL fold metallo-hydrolase [Hoeflea sp. TYP-13]|uniref:MBL fold metallo-hydrolase n=1 Tax=Hoeflea sp. TYP-13 TaxID=3230023 RepID=UPI0034C63964
MLATVTRFPDGSIMVYDTGHWDHNAKVFSEFLQFIGDSDVDLLIASHSDSDHIAATDELFNECRQSRSVSLLPFADIGVSFDPIKTTNLICLALGHTDCVFNSDWSKRRPSHYRIPSFLRGRHPVRRGGDGPAFCLSFMYCIIHSPSSFDSRLSCSSSERVSISGTDDVFRFGCPERLRRDTELGLDGIREPFLQTFHKDWLKRHLRNTARIDQ